MAHYIGYRNGVRHDSDDLYELAEQIYTMDDHREYLNDVCPLVEVGNLTFLAGDVLAKMDPLYLEEDRDALIYGMGEESLIEYLGIERYEE